MKFNSQIQYIFESQEQASSTGRTALGSLYMDWVGYADDLVFVFDDEESLRKGVEQLDQIFRSFSGSFAKAHSLNTTF